jgi:lysophospholipase L1-like esterase
MKRLFQLAYLLTATFLLLELALQLGHVIVVLTHSPRDSTSAGSAVTVLCVGDSYTFGVGANSPEGSYPGQLQEILIDRLGSEIRVSNAGWPSQNSYDVVSRLQSQLESSSPAFVSILVGTNDDWKYPRRFRPESVVTKKDATPTGRLRLELRTAKLVRILLGDRSSVDLGQRIDDGASLDSSEPTGPVPPATRARELLRQSRYGEVLEAVKAGLETHSESRQELRRLELLALGRLGRLNEAAQIAREFEGLYERDPTMNNAEYLLAALENTGQRKLSYELATSLTERYPELVLAWRIVAWRAQDRGDAETAVTAFETALTHTPVEDRTLRADTMRSLASVVKNREPDRTARLLVDAMLLDGEATRTVGTLRMALGDQADSLAATYLATLDLSDRDQRLVEDLLAGLGEDHSWDIAAANLEEIVEATLAAGAKPILLSYPFCPEDLGAIQSRVAREKGTLWVDVCSRFERELETRPWNELFVSDGHCTEAGYEIIADLVADAVLGSQ